MIKIENVDVAGWKTAIQSMRNHMDSRYKSDSGYGCFRYDAICGEKCIECNILADDCFNCHPEYIIGPNDRVLMTKLASGGPVHAKYRRMITVYLDIAAPLYWWEEFDTYKVGTVANSCSTMHKIAEKEFAMTDFSCEHLEPALREYMSKTIDLLNYYRDIYIKYDKFYSSLKPLDYYPSKKDIWWQMIQLLPSSYNQKRTVMLSYEDLAGIYLMRKDHKLDEWVDFCHWIEDLPYSEIITGVIRNDKING